MRKFNLNQRKAISESINNLSVSIFVIGIITPFFSKNFSIYKDLSQFLLAIIISLSLVIISNSLLE
jgi:hypothetical protein